MCKDCKKGFTIVCVSSSDVHWRATTEQPLSPPSGENALAWKLWAGAAMPNDAKLGVYTSTCQVSDWNGEVLVHRFASWVSACKGA